LGSCLVGFGLAGRESWWVSIACFVGAWCYPDAALICMGVALVTFIISRLWSLRPRKKQEDESEIIDVEFSVADQQLPKTY